MTNILVQPLQITHDRIDPVVLEVIRKVDATARKYNTSYFLAGATAREIILRHVFGRRPGRRTLDLDFGIAVRDWKHFQDLKTAMTQKTGFEAVPNVIQRLIYPSKPAIFVDLIPFGGIEGSENTIAWPPDEDIVMRVAGFSDALESAVLVKLDESLTIRVAYLPALLVLKLFAWMDRKQQSNKDASDILTLLREYGEAGNEDRLFSDELGILEAEGFDFEIAGARLLGIDAARSVSDQTRKQAYVILDSQQNIAQLTDHMISAAAGVGREYAGRCELLLAKFREAFLKESNAMRV